LHTQTSVDNDGGRLDDWQAAYSRWRVLMTGRAGQGPASDSVDIVTGK
jgi:hypothetical protein